MTLQPLLQALKGSSRSGHHSHRGIPGHRGGSLPGKGLPLASVLSSRNISQSIPIGATGAEEGTHGAELVTFDDGSKGVWKPWDSQSSVAEVATYELAVKLGMGDLVPETELYDRKPGTVQRFVDNAKVGTELGYSANKAVYTTKDSERLALLDYLTGQVDRHDGNWMLTNNGKLRAIDNGGSFVSYGSNSWFYKEHRNKPVPAKAVERLKTVDRTWVDGVFQNMSFTPAQERNAMSSFGEPIRKVYADLTWERIQKVIAQGKVPND